jgi:YbbR domain-containing protein|uniref:CdaR family protein n=1 Tax=Lachnospira sp. TaxID=2049031 RepID=UPI004025364E
MKEKIFNNLSLKIVSAVFAVILWTVIVNIYDPNTSYTFSNITVQLVNTQSLTEKNYTFEVVDGGKISVTVSGPKSVVTDLKTSDIAATADLSKVTAFTDYVDIQVQVVKDGQVLNNVEAVPRTSALKLSIENRDTNTYAVNVNTTGTPANGYAVASTTTSPTYIKVTGPTSLVEGVASVGVDVDVSGAKGTVNTQSDINMYDSDGNIIANEELEMSSETADVIVEMARTKTVPVVVKTSGTPSQDCVVTGTSLSQTSVVISGQQEALSKIDNITIPSSAVSVDGLSEDKTYTFKLTDYVPSGVKIVSDSRLQVTVKISKASTKTVHISSDAIKIENVSSGYNAVIEGTGIDVIISGTGTILDNVSATDITCNVNAAGLSAGTHSVDVSVSVPDGCSVSGNSSVKLTLSAKQQETTVDNSSSQTQQTTTR